MTVFRRQVRAAWFVGGLVGGLLIAPMAAGLLWVALPVLGVALALGLVVFTFRIGAGTDERATRIWAIWTWAIVASLLGLATVWYVTPPGATLPTTDAFLWRAIPAYALLAFGSAVIAVAARDGSRRWFRRDPAVA